LPESIRIGGMATERGEMQLGGGKCTTAMGGIIKKKRYLGRNCYEEKYEPNVPAVERGNALLYASERSETDKLMCKRVGVTQTPPQSLPGPDGLVDRNSFLRGG